MGAGKIVWLQPEQLWRRLDWTWLLASQFKSPASDDGSWTGLGEPPCAPLRVSVATLVSANRLLGVELTGASSNELNTSSISEQKKKRECFLQNDIIISASNKLCSLDAFKNFPCWFAWFLYERVDQSSFRYQNPRNLEISSWKMDSLKTKK